MTAVQLIEQVVEGRLFKLIKGVGGRLFNKLNNQSEWVLPNDADKWERVTTELSSMGYDWARQGKYLVVRY